MSWSECVGVASERYDLDIDLLMIEDVSGKSSGISRANRSGDSKKLLEQP